MDNNHFLIWKDLAKGSIQKPLPHAKGFVGKANRQITRHISVKCYHFEGFSLVWFGFSKIGFLCGASAVLDSLCRASWPTEIQLPLPPA